MVNPYPAWTRQGIIQVTSPSTTAGVQALLTLPWRPGMAQDFKDIRFSDIRGSVLNFWVESYTAGTSAQVWVKLPANDRKIILYYSNSNATSASNGAATFELFDDFSAAAIDNDKWTYSNASVSGGNCIIQSTGTDVERYLKSKTTYATGYAFRARMKTSHVGLTANYRIARFRPSYTSIHAIFCHSDSDWRYKYLNGSSSLTSMPVGAWSANTFEVIECRRYSNKATWIIGNGTPVDCSTGYPTSASECGFSAYCPGYTDVITTVDWIAVRKCPNSPPALSLSRTYPAPFLGIPYYPTTKITVSSLVQMSGSDTITGLDTGTRAAGSFTRKDISQIPAPGTRAACGYSSRSTFSLSPPGSKAGPATFTRKDKLTITRGTSASARSYPVAEKDDLTAYPVASISIGRNAADVLWAMNAEFIGTASPQEFKILNFDAADQAGTSRHLFTGVATETLPVLAAADNRISVTAYDYGWYLAAQYLPDDARTMNITGTRATWASWIIYLLQETGIVPYRIAEPTGPAFEFVFNSDTTKRKAIDTISDYYGFIFEIKWANVGSPEAPIWETRAYWISTADVDDPAAGLDLPAALTLTAPDQYLVDLPEISSAPEEKINRVRIRGNDGAGTYYSKVLETAAVTNGDDLPREYYEESAALTSQDLVDARATEMLNYFTAQSFTVRAKFIKRFDLALYQQIKFGSGFPTALTRLTDGSLGTTWLRILEIWYSHGPADEGVEILAVSDQAVSILLARIGRTIPGGTTDETDNQIDDAISDILYSEIGTVQTISQDGTTCTVLTEDGKTVTARIIQPGV